MLLSIEEKSAIRIQSYYKGFYIRKKIKKFYRLSYNLQRKILPNLHKNCLKHNYYCSMSKIIYSKYFKFYNNPDFKHILNTYKVLIKYENFLNSYNLILQNDRNYKNFNIELEHLMKLTIKYVNIIDKSKIKIILNEISYYLSNFIITNSTNSIITKNNEKFIRIYLFTIKYLL